MGAGDRADNQFPEVVPPQTLEVHYPQHQLPARDYHHGYSGLEPYNNAKPKNTVCGLTVPLFGIIIAVVAFILGGAVGGGTCAGVSTQKCNNKLAAQSQAASTLTSGSPTATTSSTPSSAITSLSQLPVASLGCPGSEGSLYTSNVGGVVRRYKLRCSQVVPGGDILTVMTHSLDACIEACSSYQFYNITQGSVNCVGTSFVPSWINPDYSYGNVSRNGTCFLKSFTTGMLNNGWNFEFGTAQLT